MPLSTSQFERLETMLAEMEPYHAKLRGNSRKFVEETRERLETYKLAMFFSPKQSEWLDNLYTQLLGDDAPPVEDFEP
jgi:hypothetical protein